LLNKEILPQNSFLFHLAAGHSSFMIFEFTEMIKAFWIWLAFCAICNASNAIKKIAPL